MSEMCWWSKNLTPLVKIKWLCIPILLLIICRAWTQLPDTYVSQITGIRNVLLLYLLCSSSGKKCHLHSQPPHPTWRGNVFFTLLGMQESNFKEVVKIITLYHLHPKPNQYEWVGSTVARAFTILSVSCTNSNCDGLLAKLLLYSIFITSRIKPLLRWWGVVIAGGIHYCVDRCSGQLCVVVVVHVDLMVLSSLQPDTEHVDLACDCCLLSMHNAKCWVCTTQSAEWACADWSYPSVSLELGQPLGGALCRVAGRFWECPGQMGSVGNCGI